MSKTVTIKLTNAGSKAGPFTLTDEYGHVIASDVSKDTLIQGISYIIEDNVSMITLSSTGDCKSVKTIKISDMYRSDIVNAQFTETRSACLWRHLTNIKLHNNYYGIIRPYVIEYVFSYQFQDEILQNVKDYTKAYIYLPDTTGVFSYTDKVMVDNIWFNKAILYNGQQCSGVLELVPKPKNNLQSYGMYPIYKPDGKVIIYTKSDSFYQINTFFDVVKNRSIPIAVTSCESLSYDGIINQSNMDYSNKSFKKSPLRAKDLKCRFTLDNRSDVHLISQYIITPSQISYK